MDSGIWPSPLAVQVMEEATQESCAGSHSLESLWLLPVELTCQNKEARVEGCEWRCRDKDIQAFRIQRSAFLKILIIIHVKPDQGLRQASLVAIMFYTMLLGFVSIEDI